MNITLSCDADGSDPNENSCLYSNMAKDVFDKLKEEEEKLLFQDHSLSNKIDDSHKDNVNSDSNEDYFSDIAFESPGIDEISDSIKKFQSKFPQSPFAKISKDFSEDLSENISLQTSPLVKKGQTFAIILKGPYGTTTLSIKKDSKIIEVIEKAQMQLSVPSNEKICLLKDDLIIMDDKLVLDLHLDCMEIINYNTIQIEPSAKYDCDIDKSKIRLKFNFSFIETIIEKYVTKSSNLGQTIDQLIKDTTNKLSCHKIKNIMVVYDGHSISLEESIESLKLPSDTCLDLYLN